MPTSAKSLLGRTLPGGWKVVDCVTPPSTGSCFSIGYLVEQEDGTRGYLKALDLSAALRAENMLEEVSNLTSAFRFERDLLEECRNRRLSRVVYAIEYNEASIDPTSVVGRIPYLIFERADSDIRRAMDSSATFDSAWALRTLHHICVGLRQLHLTKIAHQDLKPSNVLLFDVGAKVADLGCATKADTEGPVDDLRIPGDPRYAPPELLYGHVDPDWTKRRIGCDLYHLASMAHFLFCDISLTAALMQQLPVEHKRPQWTGTFAEILPFLEHAFGAVIDEFDARAPSRVQGSLVEAVKQLGHPDPDKRGHPKDRSAYERLVHATSARHDAQTDRLTSDQLSQPAPDNNGQPLEHAGYQQPEFPDLDNDGDSINPLTNAPLSLQRYISLFNLLATQMETSLCRELSK